MRWAITHIASSIGEPDHTERRHAGTLPQREGRRRWQRTCRTGPASRVRIGNGIAGLSLVRHEGMAACSAASRPWRLEEQQGSRSGPASQRARGAARPLDVRGATGGRGIGWPGPAFPQVARVSRGLPLEYLAGSYRNEDPGRSRDRCCGCRNGGLTKARAPRRRRWRRRSRPSGRALSRQPVPTRHEVGS